MKNRLKNILLISTFVFTYLSCGNDIDGEGIDLNEIINQVGGKTNVSNFNTLSYRVNGTSYEWDELVSNMPNPVNICNHVFDYVEEVNSRKCKFIYSNLEIKQPFDYIIRIKT